MIKRTYYLSIAGFTIQIKLHPSLFGNGETYMAQSLSLYKPFMIKTADKKNIDYSIDFVTMPKYKLIYSHDRQGLFIMLYKQINKTSIQAYYHMSAFQFPLLLKHILLDLLKGTGFMLHASANHIKNNAFLFIGRQGAGKSTIVQLLNRRASILSDDCIIVKKENSDYVCYQAPFLEKIIIKRNNSAYKIKGIYFLKKSQNKTHIEPVIKTEQNSAVLNGLHPMQNKKQFISNSKLFFKQTQNKSFTFHFAKEEETVSQTFLKHLSDA